MTSFKALEQSGWTKKASAYDEHFAMIADQAIEPILDCVGDVARRDVLDICCGTGNLVRAVAITRLSARCGFSVSTSKHKVGVWSHVRLTMMPSHDSLNSEAGRALYM
jgi:predicted RNA methylase